MSKNLKKSHINQLRESEPRWFAIYTSFKREKIVARMLSQKGIESYLPLQKKTRLYGRKRRIVELPLISCYLFVKITKPEYIRVLETEHVLKFIRFSKDLLAIPEEQIDIIKRVTGEGIDLEIDNNHFIEGDEVEVISGSLTGIKGKLVSIDGKKKFTVELHNLGYSLNMEIDPGLLGKINSPVGF